MSEQEPIHEKVADEDVVVDKAAKGGREKHGSRSAPGSRSAFAPIVLIAAGVFFLLDNLGVVGGGLNWAAAWQFWPLGLIFLGVNVLVTQFPRPTGTFLSAVVGVAAVGVFGWLLLFGAPGSLRSFGLAAAPELRAEPFSVPTGAAERAAVTLHLSNMSSNITAGDGGDLIAGTIWTRTGLALESSADTDPHAVVTVGEQAGGFSLNPAAWSSDSGRPWAISLTPDLPLDLTFDGGNGAITADLTGLTLSALAVDSGNGAVTITLPAGGGYEASIDSGNGAVTVALPAGVAARLEYDTGNGRVRVDDRFQRLSGDNDDGVYQTADYDTAAERVLLVIDTGNGAVTVNEGDGG